MATAVARRKPRNPDLTPPSRPARPTARAAAPAPAAPDPYAPLWKAYLERRDKPAFDALVAAYRPYVEQVAARFARRLPPSVELDDLVSAGCFGLMDAVAAFEPQRGVKFQTFALKRIVGAMNDSLRAQDIAPRLARRREAQVKRAQDDFRKANGRSPTEEELLRLLHGDPEEARAIVEGAEIPAMASLSGPGDDDSSGGHGAGRGGGGGGGGGGSATLEHSAAMLAARAARAEHPLLSGGNAIFERDIHRWLGRALSRSERLIIYLYYFESLNMREVGQSLGICEGRVSQIHALLLERLRARLTAPEAGN